MWNNFEFKDKKLYCYVKKALCNKEGIEVNNEKINQYCKDTLITDVFMEANGVGLASVLMLKKILSSNINLRAYNVSIQKETRILSHYEFVQKYFIFDANFKNDKEYSQLINDATSYATEAENKHKKDAIDVCCAAANIIKQKYSSFLYQ